MNDLRTRSPLVPSPGWLREEPAAAARLDSRFVLWATLLAAVLRLYGLTSQSLWVDEVMTWNMVRPGAGLDYLEQLRDNIQGPLYLAVVWPLLRLADSELMLRLPAAVAGILTVPVFARVAARLARPRAAQLAVLLLVINPFHIWYSQEARGYAFLMFFTVSAVWSWLEMARRGPTPRLAGLLAMCLAGAVWSNMSGIFLWAALALTVPWARPAGRRAWILWGMAFAGGFLAALPWLLQAGGIWAVDRVLPGAATGVALRGSTTFSWSALPYSFYTFFYGFSLGPSLRELHVADRMAALGPWLPLLGLAAAPVVVAAVAELRQMRKRTVLLSLWILVPMVTLAVLAWRNIKPWNTRYLAVAMPWALMLVARGAVVLPRRSGALVAGTICLLSLVAVAGHHGLERYAKADVRGAAAIILDDPRAAEPVLVPVVTGVYRYYDRRGTGVLDSHGVPELGDAAAADRFVADRLGGRSRAWIVLARSWFLDPRGLLVPALRRAGTIDGETTLVGARVLHWTRHPAAEQTDER